MKAHFRALALVTMTIVLAESVLAAGPATPSVLHAVDYGARLDSTDHVALWWCDATRKVSRTRPVPEAKDDAVRLEAARNDFEAVQVVIRPERALSGLKCSVSDLTGPDAARIASDQIQILRVGYVKVTAPTDKVGQAGEWPDPLPPLDRPLDVPAGVNQPLWILVHVPKTAAPGDYSGRLQLTADGWSAQVPLKLHVWNFTLPDAPRTASAFGLSARNIFRYHNVQREEDKRAVFAKYMKSFADHRISPYDPTPLDPIEYKFVPEADPPRAEVKFDRFDAAMQRAIDEWHITSFKLHIPGMGWGTFHSRSEGELVGHKAGTPKYEAMFASAIQQVEAHLRERGWLDKAYVYWFDEPEPRDYDFVKAGMARIRKYAPGICRMLTEEPIEPLFDFVDLWCPVSPAFDLEQARARQAAGEQLWWYICTGPKEPYCTLFIDHPATDLRVWLWQTWQRNISGILIWESIYWTSDTAFPDSLQNPYEDPMSYVTGYSTPRGEKKPWGNGDGRFLYPPESAAAGSKEPNLEPPVSSIRWEMLREGIEDLDYLYILADRIKTARADEELAKQARALLEVPAEITAGMTEYTYDARPIYARRQAVAQMIEKLGGGQ